MAEGWIETSVAGACSQCDAPTHWCHRTEVKYRYGGLPITCKLAVYRCEAHTVRPFRSAHVCSHKTDCPNARVEDAD